MDAMDAKEKRLLRPGERRSPCDAGRLKCTFMNILLVRIGFAFLCVLRVLCGQCFFCYSGVIPAAFATFAHFAVSALMKAPNSSGVPATTSAPSPARREEISGARSTATAS